MPYDRLEQTTPGEIRTAVDVETEKQKDHYKMLAWIGYNCAALAGVAMNDPKKFPSLEEAFPTLFERKEQQDWWVMKQRVEDFARKKKGQYI